MTSRILYGVVGSTAYGLAREDSDIDRLGIFVAPTVEIAGLNWHSSKESIVHQGQEGDDYALHEVGKFMSLCLKGNPTITELLWLDEYEQMDRYGEDLVNIREAFLSFTAIKNSYLGYATAQYKKFTSDGVKKKKHARHCVRLVRQGVELLETGQLIIKVPDPEFYWNMDKMHDGDIVRLLRSEIGKAEVRILAMERRSPVPRVPNKSKVEELLRQIRIDHLTA